MEQLITILPQLVIGAGTAAATILGVLKTNGGKLEKLSADVRSLSMDICRLTLYEANLSIEERIGAGERYVKGGGNGPTRAYYEKLLAEYREGLKLC